MDEDFSDYISYMYPVHNIPNIVVTEPHCSLAFLGKISEVSFDKDLAFSILRHANLEAPGQVEVHGIEMFGENKDIPVMILDNTILLKRQRGMIDTLLNAMGIEETSNHPFRPHVSISYGVGIPLDFATPGYVTLEKPELWWGDERLGLL